MNSKTSCFKTVVKSDIKRMWWISVLFTIFMLLFVILPAVDSVKYNLDIYSANTIGINNYLFGNLSSYTFFALLLGACLSIKLFSYLNHVASVTFSHSLPILRSLQFAAHTVSAVILTVIPFAVNTVIGFVSAAQYCSGVPFLKAAVIGIVYALLIYSICTFIGVLTGNSAAQGVFTIVLIFLLPFSIAFFQTLCEHFLYGFPNVFSEVPFIIELLFLKFEDVLTLKGFVYLFLIAIFCFASVFVYNKRHLENHGEVIAFPNLRGLFKAAFAICAGILGYFYCYGFWGIKEILVMLLFGTLGAIAANMISNKNFGLKGCLAPIIANTVFVLLLFFVFVLDITGYESRVPDADDVESIVVSEFLDDGRTYGKIKENSYYEELYFLHYYNPVFKEKDDIENFVNFHKNKIADKSDNGFSYAWYDGLFHNIEFEYTLKNGTKIKRRYYFSDSDMETFIPKLIESDEYKKYKFPIVDGIDREYTSLVINNSDGQTKLEIPANSEQGRIIIEALNKDVCEMTFEDFEFRNLNSCEFVLWTKYDADVVDLNSNRGVIEESYSYNIGVDFDNTFNAINKIIFDNGFDYLENYSFESAEIFVDKIFKKGTFKYKNEAAVKNYDLVETFHDDMFKNINVSIPSDVSLVVDYVKNKEHEIFDNSREYVFFTIRLKHINSFGDNRYFDFKFFEQYDVAVDLLQQFEK